MNSAFGASFSTCFSGHTRRVLVAVLTAVVLVAVAAQRATAAPIISLASPAVATKGHTFTVDVDVTGAADLYAFQLTVTFDPLLLAAIDVLEGSFLPGAGPTSFFPGFIDNTAGLITFVAGTLAGAGPGANGDGTLFSVTFAAIQAGAAMVGTLANGDDGDDLFDSALASIPGASTAALTTVVVRPGTVPEPATVSLLAIGFAYAWHQARRARASRRGGER